MTVAPAGPRPDQVGTGSVIELDIGPIAHGGHCVARYDGKVVFVRHALPGERVIARVTDGDPASRYLRADAEQVLRPSPDRVPPRCVHARPGGCGGCDFQHVAVPAQRALKADVVREQMTRLARLGDHPAVRGLVVEPVPGDADGLAWRTRVRLAATASGQLGLRRHRSHQIEVLPDCPLLHPAVARTQVLARRWPAAAEVAVAASPTTGESVLLVDGAPAPGYRRTWLTEQAAGRSWRVDATGFWQVHPGAADALVDAVRAGLLPRSGEHVVDLYCGVGLFAGALASDVGAGGRIDAVESDPGATRAARRNLHDLPQVRLYTERADAWLRHSGVRRCDLVVLDPPRAGAGRSVVERLDALRPRAVAYVACDPAALARDIGSFTSLGWRLAGLRAFDLFPMTHHVECVAVLQTGATDPAPAALALT